jgi:hypothetical protein
MNGEPPEFCAEFSRLRIPGVVAPGAIVPAKVRVRNVGRSAWPCNDDDVNPVHLAVWVWGSPVTVPLPIKALAPKHCVDLSFSFCAPDQPGPARLKLDLVRQKIAFFEDLGGAPLVAEFLVRSGEVRSRQDARILAQYGYAVLESSVPQTTSPAERFGAWLRLRNEGWMTWDVDGGRGRHVTLVAYVDDRLVSTVPLLERVLPLQETELNFAVPAPVEPGNHRLRVDLIHQGVTAFVDRGLP